MKIIGIIGGIGPESTVGYYKQLISGYRNLRPDGSYPTLIINSIDLKRMLEFCASDRAGLAKDLLLEIDRLANAGAEIGLLASNLDTTHIHVNAVLARAL